MFPGDSEIDELFLIFRTFGEQFYSIFDSFWQGTPTEHEWPRVTEFPDYNEQFPKFKPERIKDVRLPSNAKCFLKVR